MEPGNYLALNEGKVLHTRVSNTGRVITKWSSQTPVQIYWAITVGFDCICILLNSVDVVCQIASSMSSSEIYFTGIPSPSAMS